MQQWPRMCKQIRDQPEIRPVLALINSGERRAKNSYLKPQSRELSDSRPMTLRERKSWWPKVLLLC